MFGRQIQVGDVVVAYSHRHIYAIANIASKYSYQKGTSDEERWGFMPTIPHLFLSSS